MHDSPARRILPGKTAVVTGGAGVLGGGIIRTLLFQGARAAVPFRRRGELDRLRKSLGIDAGAPLSRALVDLTGETAVPDFAESNIVNAAPSSTIDRPANRRAHSKADRSPWVPPEAIASAVPFLVGPDARIVSGAHAPVYGRA